jgi:FAD/FMN-containing dehydrogenase
VAGLAPGLAAEDMERREAPNPGAGAARFPDGRGGARPCGAARRGERGRGRTTARGGRSPTSQVSESGPFVDTEYDFYCKGLRPKECTLADKSAAGKFRRSALHSKSDVASRPWPRGGLSRLIEWIEKRQRDRTLTPHDFSSAQTVGKVLIEAADGAVNSIAPDATAFVHRNNLFVAQYQARWRSNSPQEVVAANLDWADGLYAAVKPYRSGFAYQNYIDANLEDWEHAYYGANLARLREVKSKYDPDNFFRFAQSITPA